MDIWSLFLEFRSPSSPEISELNNKLTRLPRVAKTNTRGVAGAVSGVRAPATGVSRKADERPVRALNPIVSIPVYGGGFTPNRPFAALV